MRRPRTEAGHRREDHGSEGLTDWSPYQKKKIRITEIGRSYNVSAATISRLTL